MPERLVVIGGSAGSLEPLRQLIDALPADFPAPVLVVMHVSRSTPGALPKLLNRTSALTVRHAKHGDPLVPGEVLVSPPDRHLVVREDVVHLSHGPRENRHRPAVDALFNSAARWHGPNVIGVVLSGAMDDGAAGAAAIAAQDGLVLVQDPNDAQWPGMPRAALQAVRRAHSAPGPALADFLVELLSGSEAGGKPPDETMSWEASNVDSSPVEQRGDPPGTPAALGCPECQGGMFEANASGTLHYVCHVGHTWSPQSLIQAQRESSEAALYNAASKLLEEAAVFGRLAELAESEGEIDTALGDIERLRREAEAARKRATTIQEMIRGDGGDASSGAE